MGGPSKAFKMFPDWRYGHFWLGKGYKDAGVWDPGRYTVKVYVDEKLVATRAFTINRKADSAPGGSEPIGSTAAPSAPKTAPAPKAPAPANNTTGKPEVVYIEPTYRPAHFPAPVEYGGTNAEYALWKLDNDSGERLILHYSINGSSKTVVVAPWTTRFLYLRPGSYKVTGSLTRNGVKRDFSRTYLFYSGKKYKSVIFAEKR
jgi:hypothetical protein